MTESRTVEADPARFRRHLGLGVPFPARGSKKAYTWSTKGASRAPERRWNAPVPPVRPRHPVADAARRGSAEPCPCAPGVDDVPVGDEDGRRGERV